MAEKWNETMVFSQFLLNGEQHDLSWHFTICRQHRDCWQCFSTQTVSGLGGLYAFPTGTARQ